MQQNNTLLLFTPAEYKYPGRYKSIADLLQLNSPIYKVGRLLAQNPWPGTHVTFPP